MSLLPAKYKKDRIKNNREKVEISFSHYKSIRVFCCHGNQSFDPICPKTLCSLSHHLNDATHKIWTRLANWLQRYSSSKVWNFRHSWASNSKMSGLIQPKIELDRVLMPVLVTSNFDDDLIKNERTSMETPFPHYKSMGAFCCHGHQRFDPICLKTVCSLSPPSVMLQIKFN